MKLELREINIEEINVENNKSIETSLDNFKSFDDILNFFERQDNLFNSLEKEFIVSPVYQMLYIFSFLLCLHLSFTWVSLAIKFATTYFFYKFIKKSKLDFNFSSFIYGTLSFLTCENKVKNHQILIYNKEKKDFLFNFFSIPNNKEIILNYLSTFYKENEYRLSSSVYTEIDIIKSSIEKESYELAFDKILSFKNRIDYIKKFKN